MTANQEDCARVPGASAFTLNFLLQAIKESFGTENRRLPSNESLFILARRLEGFRRFYQDDENLKFLRDAIEAARIAASRYEKALEELQNQQQKLLDFAERRLSLNKDDREAALSAPILKKEIAELEGMRAEITKQMQSPALEQRGPNVGDRWQKVALDIADAYRNAVTPNNPGYALGASDDGPVAKFVFEIIPHLTGERPRSVASVARQIRTESARAGKNLEK